MCSTDSLGVTLKNDLQCPPFDSKHPFISMSSFSREGKEWDFKRIVNVTLFMSQGKFGVQHELLCFVLELQGSKCLSDVMSISLLLHLQCRTKETNFRHYAHCFG